jgi:hypothetical protein
MTNAPTSTRRDAALDRADRLNRFSEPVGPAGQHQPGRLGTVTTKGRKSDGKYETLDRCGARSVTIWTPQGAQVFDRGDDVEHSTADILPAKRTATNDEDNVDNCSDGNFPEPESVGGGEVRRSVTPPAYPLSGPLSASEGRPAASHTDTGAAIMATPRGARSGTGAVLYPHRINLKGTVQ